MAEALGIAKAAERWCECGHGEGVHGNLSKACGVWPCECEHFYVQMPAPSNVERDAELIAEAKAWVEEQYLGESTGGLIRRLVEALEGRAQ